MTLQNYSLHIQGLPPIKLSYHLLPGGGNGWLQYTKYEAELNEEQQLYWQGLQPWTISQLRQLETADPLRVRVTRLEDLPFKSFWDKYMPYCNKDKAKAEKFWGSMSTREKKLALQHLPDFIADKLKSLEHFPYAIRYLRDKRYLDYVRA
ncbi:MAG: hypothetical protein ACK52I_14860 [Pseudomonadota bacterium]|jgi:hypothetical protein